MKILLFLFLFHLFLNSYQDCASDFDCRTRKYPVCENSNCVECRNSSDCDFDSYCNTDSYECQKYKDDNKFKKFCQSDDCADNNNAEVCGVCNGGYQWTGSCIEFKCYPCQVNGPDSEIMQSHKDVARCYPKSTSGSGGYLGPYQATEGRPRDLKQDSPTLGLMMLGFAFGIMTILQCIIFFKIR
ncbi:hypothetical protein M0811_09874 [Anaeramoeba ignava]|uniref:Uncharacterized protein n=1 Tax=Anaeramoeba ignava TaxID=1746090 RepID=A0A9Q0LGI1_ANAIG|nr:hypothetical protein M0811_09874 [Anaeramoeba ignava]